MSSLFSLFHPTSVFQIWFLYYLYLLPILLYASWAGLSLMDLAEQGTAPARTLWALVVLAVPLAGGALYLLTRARYAARAFPLAVVLGGLIVWLVPLALGLWLAGGPLGPKALN